MISETLETTLVLLLNECDKEHANSQMNSKIWSPSDATTREGETPMTRELSSCTEVQVYRGTEAERQRSTEAEGYREVEGSVHRCPAGMGTKPTQGSASFPSRASALHSDDSNQLRKKAAQHPLTSKRKVTLFCSQSSLDEEQIGTGTFVLSKAY